MPYRSDGRDTELALRRQEMDSDLDFEDGGSGSATGRLVVGLVTAGALIGIGYLVMKNVPEMRRYLRIRAM